MCLSLDSHRSERSVAAYVQRETIVERGAGEGFR
jgi:hypothetical protein